MATSAIYKLVAELKADSSQFQQEFEKANKTAEKTKAHMEKVAESVNKISNKMLVAGGALTAVSGVLIKGAAEWERGFADLHSVLDMNAVQMERLKTLAVDFSNEHKVASDSIINSYYSMASAGMNFNEIMASTSDVATLAIAAAQPLQDMNSAMDDSVNIFTDAMNVYRDEFDNLGYSLEERSGIIMNTIAGSVQAFKTTLPEMRGALKNVAGDAANAGMGFEELNASLGILMTNGKKAEEAGTGLRSMLVRLQTTASDFGIDVYEANGSLKDLSLIMADVKDYMDGFSSQTEKAKAMTQLFGMEQQGIAKILMANVDNLEKQTQALKESSSALEMAAYRESDLGSQLQILKNNFQNLGASLGEFLLPMMHEITEALKGFSQWLQGLSPEVQGFIAKLVGIGGPVLLAAGGIGKLVASLMKLGIAFSAIGKFTGFTKIITEVKGLGNVTADASKLLGDMSGTGTQKFGVLGQAIGKATSGLKNFNSVHPKIASAIGWTAILTAGLAAIQALTKKATDEVTALYNQMNEFGDIEVDKTFWNSLPFVGDTFKAMDYANAMSDYVNELRSTNDEVTEVFSGLAKMSREGFTDIDQFETFRSQAQTFIDFLNEAKAKAEAQGKTLEEYFPSGLGQQYINLAEEMQVYIAEGEEAFEIQEELRMSNESLGVSLVDLDKAFENMKNVGNMNTDELKAYKIELQMLIERFGSSSEQGQQLASTLTEVDSRLKDLTQQQKEAAAAAKLLEEQQQNLTNTLDGYKFTLAEIAVKADLFKLDEWEVMEQHIQAQKTTLEQLAKQYVNGEISVEHYNESIEKLLPSYEKNQKAIENHNKALEEQKKKEEELARVLEEQKQAREGFNELYDNLDENIKNRIENAELEGNSLDELTAKREAYQEALKKMVSLSDDMGDLTDEERAKMAELREEIKALILEEERREKRLKEHEAAMIDLNKAYEAQAGSINLLKDAIGSFDGSTNAYEEQANAMLVSLEALEKQLDAYKSKMEELEELKGTDAFDPDLYDRVKQGMDETGLAINNLENDFKDLKVVSEGFAGVFDGLALSMKKTALEFEIFGDKLDKLKSDMSAYKKAIDDLLSMKASKPNSWTAENEAELQRLVQEYKNLTDEIERLEAARKSEEEAAKKQLEAEKVVLDFLNEIKLAEEKLLDSNNVEEYLNDMISIYKTKKDELLKAISIGENVEENRKELEGINAILGEYTTKLDDLTTANENAKKATETFTKASEDLNETLEEGGKRTLDKVEKEIEAYKKAIEGTEKHLGSLTQAQVEGLEEWRKKIIELQDEAADLAIPFERLETIQKEIGAIDIKIGDTEDINEHLDLVKQKLILLSEEAEIVPSLAIDQKEIDKMLGTLETEYAKTYTELLKITEKGAKEQVDKIKEAYKDVAPVVVKNLKKLTKEYEKEFLNGLMDEKQYEIKIEQVNKAIQEATERSLKDYQSMMSKYEDEPTVFEAIAGKMEDDLSYVQDMYEAGLIDLEEYYKAQRIITENAAEEQAQAIKNFNKAYVDAMGGDEGAMAQALLSAEENYKKQIELIENLAESYGEVWANQQKDNAFQKFLDTQSKTFDDYFVKQIEGFAKLADESTGIFEKAELLEKFKEQFGDIEGFLKDMQENLETLRPSIGEENYQAGLTKLKEFYDDFKEKVNEEEIKVNLDMAHFKEQCEKIAGYFSGIATLLSEAAKLVDGEWKNVLNTLATVASGVSDIAHGTQAAVAGFQSGKVEGIIGGIGGIIEIIGGLVNISGAVTDWMNTSEEAMKDLQWTQGKGISEALDFSKFESQLDWGDNVNFLGSSAGFKRFGDVVKTVISGSVEPAITKIKQLADENERLAEEAGGKGLTNLSEFYSTASEKLKQYGNEMEIAKKKALDNLGSGFLGFGEKGRKDAIKQAGIELEALAKKAQTVASVSVGITTTYAALDQQGLMDTGLGQMLDDIAEKATIKLEAGEDLGELAVELENLKTLAETVGSSFRVISDGLGKMGIASGKYKARMDELNNAFQEGTITQEEYVSEIQKLADEVELLAGKHSAVTDAIKETGQASVFLQKELNELDQSFVDGKLTQQEYIQALEKLGYKAQDVAEAYSVIRDAIAKVGQPAEVLREQFEALAEALNKGTISEEEFSQGLEELGNKATVLVSSMNEFESVMENINNAFAGTNIGIGQAFTDEMDTLKTALANGEISLDEFILKVNNLSSEAQGFYSTFESVKSTLSSGLSGAIKSFITFEFDDSMMGELQAYVERVQGVIYGSSEEFSKAFADMGKEGQEALINEFKYDQFKQSLDASLKQAILDSLMESLMMQGAIQGQLQELSAFIAAAMKDGLSQGEMDAISSMMGDMQDVATEMASVVAETWQNVGGEIQTSSEEIEKTIEQTLSGVGGIGEEAAEEVNQAGEDMVTSTKENVEGVSDSVKTQVDEMVDAATEGMGKLPEEAKAKAEETGVAVAEGVKAGTEEVKKTMQETLESLSSTIEQLNEMLSKGIGTMDTSGLENSFSGLSEGLKTETDEMLVQLQGLPEETEGIKTRITDAMADMPKQVTEKTLEAKDAMVQELEGIPVMIEDVAQRVATSMDALNAQLGISTDNSGQIDQLGQFVAENSQMIMDFKTTVLTTINDVMAEAQQLALDAIMANVNNFAGLLIEQARIMFAEEITITQQIFAEILGLETQTHMLFVQEAQLKREEYLQKTDEQIGILRERMLKLSTEYFQVLQGLVTSAAQAMVSTTQNAASQIQGIVSSVVSAVQSAASAASAAVQSAKADMASLEKEKAEKSELKGFASGGYIESEGLAYLHSGEMVVPRIAVGKIFGQDMPTPNWVKNNTSNSNQTNVSVGSGAIQVSARDGMNEKAIAEAVLEELERRLANEIHRNSEVMPY